MGRQAFIRFVFTLVDIKSVENRVDTVENSVENVDKSPGKERFERYAPIVNMFFYVNRRMAAKRIRFNIQY